MTHPVYRVQEGYIDCNGLLLYYTELGTGQPLIVLHGGPGGSHNYFLPYLLPLARSNRLIFMDERGSGRSGKFEDASAYTVEHVHRAQFLGVFHGYEVADEMHHNISGSQMAVLPKSKHTTFVDQNALFNNTVDAFIHPR